MFYMVYIYKTVGLSSILINKRKNTVYSFLNYAKREKRWKFVFVPPTFCQINTGLSTTKLNPGCLWLEFATTRIQHTL